MPCDTFSETFTTGAFVPSRFRWFATRSCKPIARGQSYVISHLLRRLLRHTDVTDPHAVQRCHRFHGELPIEHVGRDRMCVLGIRRHSESPRRFGAEPFLLHDSRDTLHAMRVPLRFELLVHARTPVSPASLFVDPRNHLCELGVVLGMPTRRPADPRIVAGLLHLQHATHRRHVELGRVDRDERESHRTLLAKKAVAFPRMSRSSRNTAFSRRSRRISSSWLINLPLPGKMSAGGWPVRACAGRAHWRSISGRMPNSRATSLTRRSPTAASRTASSLKSWVNRRRARGA